MKNGSQVAAFEREFSQYVGAKYAIALCNGTATLHTALVALGVKPGDRVAVPPLTMSATTIAVLHTGAVPYFLDVCPTTWTMGWPSVRQVDHSIIRMPVSLYGLHSKWSGRKVIDDAAQTLRPFRSNPNNVPAFVSYSFQASKIIALGEGGMLVTDDEALATRAREFSSLGYRMRADQPRIDPAILKDPTYERHHSMGWNYRMNDLTAAAGLRAFDLLEVPITMEDGAEAYVQYPTGLDGLKAMRRRCADLYRQAIHGCDWITPQHVPDGYTHDYWSFAVALKSADLWHPFTDAIVRHGGEMPYGAWRLTYQEPAFRHLVPTPSKEMTGEDGCGWEEDLPYPDGIPTGICPIAEDLQPRLVQFQTNDLPSAERNAEAVRKAIQEIGG